jgi:hypothetical protein
VSPASFFKRLNGTRRLGVMARAGRQLAVAHRPQFAAERLLRNADLVFLPDPLAQIDDPPADHAVHGRDRAVLDHRCQRGTVRIVQQRRLAGSLAVDQSLGTVRVEPQCPVTHHLQRHATNLRSVRAAASVIDHGQRQEPPHLIGVLDLSGNPAQLCRTIVRPQWDRLPHGEPPPFASLESNPHRVGQAPH